MTPPLVQREWRDRCCNQVRMTPPKVQEMGGGRAEGGAARMKTREAMAADLGLSLTTFDNWVKDGTLPGPLNGKRKWDSKAVHAALDRASGLAERSGASVQGLIRRSKGNASAA